MPFRLSKKAVFFGHFTWLCVAKIPPVMMKVSPLKLLVTQYNGYNLQNRHIGELQSWHSSRHFRIPIAPAISTLQLRLGTLGQRSSLNCGAVQTEVEATISLQSSVRLNPIMCCWANSGKLLTLHCLWSSVTDLKVLPSYDRWEPVVNYRWTSWVWDISGWSSRLQENYPSFWRNL